MDWLNIHTSTLDSPEHVPHLEKCEFDDECDFCSSPSMGTYAKMIRIPGENPEVDFYVCGRCAEMRDWMPSNSTNQPCPPNTLLDGHPPLPVRTDGGLLQDKP